MLTANMGHTLMSCSAELCLHGRQFRSDGSCFITQTLRIAECILEPMLAIRLHI